MTNQARSATDEQAARYAAEDAALGTWFRAIEAAERAAVRANRAFWASDPDAATLVTRAVEAAEDAARAAAAWAATARAVCSAR